MQKLLKNFIQVGPYCYRPQDKIGEGSSSTVYKGYRVSSLIKHSSHHQCYSIKQIKNSNHENLVQIEQELKILMMFRQQQGIIKLLDVIYENDKIYIITELCEGGTLKNFLKDKGPLSEEVALGYFRQLVNAYESIYKKNIVHRDIKPANILLKNNKIKVADFGFAATKQQVEKQKMRVGSPLYMPYEALKHNIYSYKGDVWAMGIILYEMLIGQTPFKSFKIQDLINQILHFDVSSKLPANLSSSTIQLLQKLLKIDVKERVSFISLKNIIFRTPEEKKKNSPMKTAVYTTQREKGQSNKTRTILNSRNSQNRIENPQLTSFKRIPTYNQLQKVKTIQALNYQSENELIDPSIDLSKINNQQILEKLVSQIHLIRFIFKIWQLIKQNKQFSYNWILKNYLVGLIFMKLEETQKLKLLSQYQIACFNNSAQFKTLLEYCRCYRSKYSELTIIKISENPTIQKMLKLLPSQLSKIYLRIKQQEFQSKTKSKAIISLDLLITLYQLLDLLKKQGLEYFGEVSKIEVIASMKNFQDVNEKHLLQIEKKLSKIKLL